jgi:predicted component of type VI protein secretion system
LKNPPRFIPTLTEVVDSPGTATVAALASRKTSDRPEVEASRLIRRIQATLEPRIQAAVTVVVQAHLKSLGPLLEREIDRVVREAVKEAVAKDRL